MNARPGLRLAALLAGSVGVLAGFSALVSIPRTDREFNYCPTGNPLDIYSPLPFAAMNGFTPEQLSSHLARLLILGPALLLLGWAVGPACRRLVAKVPAPRTAALAGALLVALAALAVFRGIPTQDDEPTYLMQAGSIARGHLFEAPVPVEQRWHEPFTIFTDRVTTGKYLFGEPIVLAPGVLLGVPLLGHIALAAATILLFGSLLRRDAGEEVARLGAILLALSPQLVFTSAQALSQTTALALVVLALWGARRGGAAGGWIAGASLGLALATRPQMAVPCGAVVLLLHVRDRKLLAGAAAGGAIFVALILLYDRAISGNPFLLPWDIWYPERFGFGRPFGPRIAFEHTPGKGLAQALVAAVRLNGWALGWPLSLIGPACWLACGRPFAAAVRPWAWMTAATFAFQIAFYSVGTSDTGALYHHAALPFVAASTAAVAAKLLASPRAATAAGVLTAFVTIGGGSFLVEHALRLRRLTDALAAPYAGLSVDAPALVFVEVVPPDRDLVGWLNGVAFRSRTFDEPLLYYPLAPGTSRMTPGYARNTAGGRACYVRRWDSERGAFVTEGCDLLARAIESADGRRQAHARRKETEAPAGSRRAQGWRRAFPWLGPLLGPSSSG